MTFEWKHPKHYTKIRKDFREEIEKEKKELAECYEEGKRQGEERKAKERKALDIKKKV